jgi:hypothetical protein
MKTKTCNGRVDIMKNACPDISKLFEMYDKIPANQCSTFRDPTAGLWNETSLSLAFFSEKNIQILQNGIRAGVYERSNGQYVIGQQDCDSLKIVMRSVFLQNAANQPTSVQQQVEQLNKIVWDYCIHQVYSEAIGYHKYLEDASTMYKPMDPPIMSQNNDKQLQLKPWF